MKKKVNKLKENLKEFFDNFLRVLKRPEMSILPGQLAFFFVLAIVPTITLISYGATLLNLSTDVIFDFIGSVFSPEIANMLLNTSSTSTTSGFALVIVIVMGYYIASNGPASIIVTSNTIYGEKQTNFFKRRFKAIIMTLVLVLLFIFMLIVPVFGNKIVELFEYVNIPEVTENVSKIFSSLQGPITWIIIYFFVKILYTMAPNRKIKSKTVGYGAIFTSITWILITYIYSFYVNHLAHYTTFYGGLANIVVLMLWIYFLSYAFTIGMALNCRREEVELEKTGTIKKVE